MTGCESLILEARAAIKVTCPQCDAPPGVWCNMVIDADKTEITVHRARRNLGVQLHPLDVIGAPS